jgi:hypothetical protein
LNCGNSKISGISYRGEGSIHFVKLFCFCFGGFFGVVSDLGVDGGWGWGLTLAKPVKALDMHIQVGAKSVMVW